MSGPPRWIDAVRSFNQSCSPALTPRLAHRHKQNSRRTSREAKTAAGAARPRHDLRRAAAEPADTVKADADRTQATRQHAFLKTVSCTARNASSAFCSSQPTKNKSTSDDVQNDDIWSLIKVRASDSTWYRPGTTETGRFEPAHGSSSAFSGRRGAGRVDPPAATSPSS